jgi:hypothetical protein
MWTIKTEMPMPTVMQMMGMVMMVTTTTMKVKVKTMMKMEMNQKVPHSARAAAFPTGRHLAPQDQAQILPSC